MDHSHPNSLKSQHDAASTAPKKLPVTPLRCFTGALISTPIAIAMYFFTTSVGQTFAAKSVTGHSALAIRISIMVRTLVLGMGALGTAIFIFTTLGVLALGVQLSLQSRQPNGSAKVQKSE